MLSRLYTFSPGTSISSSQVNAELNQIVQLLSGNKLDATLLKASSTSDPTLGVDNTGGGKPQEWRIGGVTKARITENGIFESVVATGAAPLIVASTTKVANLNADQLDGKDVTDLLLAVAPSVKFNSPDSRIDFEESGGKLRIYNDATGFTIFNVDTSAPLLSINKSTKVVTVYGVLKGITPVAAADLVRKDYADALASAAAAAGSLAASTVTGISGGTDGHVVRWSSGTTWTNASAHDSTLTLDFVLFKAGGQYYLPGSVIPMTVTPGQRYFLGDGVLDLTPNDPSSTWTQKLIGWGITSSQFLFYPERAIGG